MKFLGMPREKYLKHLPINTELSYKRNVPYSNSCNKLAGQTYYLFWKGILTYQWQVSPPFPTLSAQIKTQWLIWSSSLLPTVREFSSTTIINVILCLAGKHVPTAGGQRTDFSTPSFFSDQQWPAVFPRDSFLYKEINYNIELQEVKVIALTFQFAYSTDASELFCTAVGSLDILKISFCMFVNY